MSTYGSTTTRGTRVFGDDVAKGLGVKPVLARVNPAAGRGAKRTVHGKTQVIGKADPATRIAQYGVKARPNLRRKLAGAEPTGEFASRLKAAQKAQQGPVAKAGLLGGLKTLGQTARSGFAAGGRQRAGAMGAAAKPRMGLGASVSAAKSPMLGRVSTASQWAGRNPIAAGGMAGGAATAGLLAGNGRRNTPAYGGVLPYGQFGKRSYDPEAERRFRQGAYATGTGIGGLALGNQARRTILADTAHTRDLVGRKSGNAKGAAAVAAENARQGRLKSMKGVTLSRKGALQAAGGTLLLGGSGALLKNRHEERWD